MKKITLLFLLLLFFQLASSQEKQFLNPIIPGAYPDPSICKVGDNFYIVNSSFEYFPALPIHKSKDLVNWELIGYGLDRKEQGIKPVNLVDVQSDGGIHAPTIRYNNGLFYIITTNVYYHEDTKTTDFVNFIITAENAAGPWSEPHVLEGAPGIDPDIFFDDNGKVWYVGTHSPENPNFPGEGEIWLQEIDITNWKLIGERHFLWRGACGGVWAEGPHMYKKDGRYYLMIAEGGTSYNHAMMIAVSDNIEGPFIGNDRNPILSTRHLSYDNWVHSSGHADLIELDDGRWFMVALAIRGDEKRASNMGRETHLLPVKWEREPYDWKEVKYEWPVIAPNTGKIERYNPLPFAESQQRYNNYFTDSFDSKKLNLEWNFRRVPLDNIYSLKANQGHLRLYSNKNKIKERGSTSLIGFRQRESNFEYSAKMNFKPRKNNVEAGVSLVQKDNNYIVFVVSRKNSSYFLQTKLKSVNSEEKILKEEKLSSYSGELFFKIESKDSEYIYSYSLNGLEFLEFDKTPADLILSKGYTGAYCGLYTTSNGQKTKDYADFDWVHYVGFPIVK